MNVAHIMHGDNNLSNMVHENTNTFVQNGVRRVHPEQEIPPPKQPLENQDLCNQHNVRTKRYSY